MTAVATFAEHDARRLTERIRLLTTAVQDSLTKLATLIAEAREQQVHLALGYRSWPEYVVAEFGQTPLQLDRDDRRELVVKLAGLGMSTRAIAPVIGADQKTVVRDLATEASASVAERNVTSLNGSVRTVTPRPAPPAAPPPEVAVDAEVVDWTPRPTSPEDHAAAEESRRRARVIEDARIEAGRIVTVVRVCVATVIAGTEEGIDGLITHPMLADLRAAIDLLEARL